MGRVKNLIIEDAYIEKASKWGDKNKIIVKCKDCTETTELYEYYDDELSFSASEFIGLTAGEALQLCFDKDVAYLRS